MKFRFLILVAVLALVLASCTAHGGGWIASAAGEGKATFGFGINCTQIDAHNILFTGQVQYNDMPAGVKFHGEIYQPYTVTSAEISCDEEFVTPNPIFNGTYVMEPSGQTGGFNWMVNDHGEPGPSEGDVLIVRVWDGPAYVGLPDYENSGVIGGGNIQIMPDSD